MGLPRPVDEDWLQIQKQIDAIVHEFDLPDSEDTPGHPPDTSSHG